MQELYLRSERMCLTRFAFLCDCAQREAPIGADEQREIHHARQGRQASTASRSPADLMSRHLALLAMAGLAAASLTACGGSGAPTAVPANSATGGSGTSSAQPTRPVTTTAAAKVDLSSATSIIAALNAGGYPCANPQVQSGVYYVAEEIKCTHATDGDVSVDTASSTKGIDEGVKAGAGYIDAARVVRGDRWVVFVPTSADAAKVRSALGLTS